MNARDFAPPCEFCTLPDGAHASTCELLRLALDLEVHALGVVFEPRAFDASDRRAREAEGWPAFINLPGA